MSELLWFAVWAIILFLMMRYGCGAHVMGHGAHKEKEGSRNDGDALWEAPETDIDPVCAKTVKTANAKPSVFNGHVFYFCSRECREVFEAAPETYVNQNPETAMKQLGGSHA